MLYHGAQFKARRRMGLCVWRLGLSELSGGQRSLLALSLILAMLLFKPAPIYILDEVPSFLPVLFIYAHAC